MQIKRAKSMKKYTNFARLVGFWAKSMRFYVDFARLVRMVAFFF